MRLMQFFSRRFIFYVVVRNVQYEWMDFAVRDWVEMVYNMDWNKYIEGYLIEGGLYEER